jgi:hypothetical protein
MALNLPPGSTLGPKKRAPLNIPAPPPFGSVPRTAPPPAPPPALALNTATPSEPKSATPPTPNRIEAVQKLYHSLSQAAIELNSASDSLAAPIRVYEGALKKLNLGLSAWVHLSEGGREEWWWDRSVGYTKMKDGWAIALRTREGDHRDSENDSEEIWPFSDAPRWMRIEAVNKLPDLLQALLNQAHETTKKIKARIAQANEIAEAISMVSDEISMLEER